jgi:hypothetical protein
MQGKKSFVLYTDQREVFDELSDQDAGKLIKHIFAYVNDEDPVTEDKLLKVAFLPIKTQLKRDLKSWEAKQDQRREAGKKSAESRQRNSTAVNDRSISLGGNVNVNVNGNENVNGNANDISSITIFTTRRLGGKNLFEEMAHIYDLNDEQVQKLFQEWELTHDDRTFESEKHLKNSFILFVKNNANRFKQVKATTYRQKEEKPKSKNIFADMYQELLKEEELKKSNQ